MWLWDEDNQMGVETKANFLLNTSICVTMTTLKSSPGKNHSPCVYSPIVIRWTLNVIWLAKFCNTAIQQKIRNSALLEDTKINVLYFITSTSSCQLWVSWTTTVMLYEKQVFVTHYPNVITWGDPLMNKFCLIWFS